MNKSPKLVQNDANAPKLQMSLENDIRIRDRLMELVLDTTAESDRLAFYISVLSPWADYPSENKQNIRIAQIAKTTPQTVWNWRSGVTQCSALGRLYGFARMRFENEYEMAVAFGAAVGRNFLTEAGIDPETLK